MEIVKPTFGRLVLLWWSIIWRCAAYGLGGAVIIGVILGVILGIIGASHETMVRVGELAGVAIGVIACAYVGWACGKTNRGLSIGSREICRFGN